MNITTIGIVVLALKVVTDIGLGARALHEIKLMRESITAKFDGLDNRIVKLENPVFTGNPIGFPLPNYPVGFDWSTCNT